MNVPDRLSILKLPPQELEFEEAVLGAAIIERDSLPVMLELINDPDVFYKTAHQHIFRALQEMFNAGTQVDLLTLVQQLKKNKTLDEVGGILAITTLTDRINSSAHMRQHILTLLEAYMRRSAIETAHLMQRAAYEPDYDVFRLLDASQQSLDRIRNRLQISEARNGTEVLKSALGRIRKGMDSKEMVGVPSGIKALDDLTGGWQTALYILAARPKMGKTALVIAFAIAAVLAGHPVDLHSLEMKGEELMNRIISMCVYIATRTIITPSELGRPHELSERHYEMIQYVMKKFNLDLLFIDDQSAVSIQELRSKAIKQKSKNKTKLIIVDYLQLMTGDKDKGGNREQEIASISRGLKNLSKDLDVPVIALSQLSRAVETRGGDKRPQLSDLRESGSIEQDANCVMFVFRPEYYNITQDEAGNSTKNVAELIIAANRNGPTDTIQYHYNAMVNYVRDTDEYLAKHTSSSIADPLKSLSANDSIEAFENDQSNRKPPF